MLILNTSPDHGSPLDAVALDMLGAGAPAAVAPFLAVRADHVPTPLVALDGLAATLGIGALDVKDEGQRLGLGSFKALGGAYAVVRLAIEAASARAGRAIDIADWRGPEVAAAAAGMTVACATDGNHGRSVAQGAVLIGAACVIFVHAGVSDGRVAAIAGYGARIVRVEGSYEDSVVEAARVAAAEGWITVSDTSWPGYERIPYLVMQGYTAMLAEAAAQWRAPPSHVFIQAGVGGVAAAIAAHFADLYGTARPKIVVVEPGRAACLFESARAGAPIRIAHGAPTVMAMLECCEPSLIAWRILARVADAFLTIDDAEAVAAMNRLARPEAGDPAIVAGESGCAGLAGLIHVAGDPALRAAIGLGPAARVLLINTEGATDPVVYERLTGLDPKAVRMLT